MQLVRPGLDYLPSYKAALERGWSPDNVRKEAAARAAAGYRGRPLRLRVLGHIGFEILRDAKAEGLPYVELTCEEDNEASQRVIVANGGVPLGRFEKGVQYGGGTALRFRIAFQT